MNHVFLIDRLPHLHNFLQIFITFLLACFAWVFFRAGSLHEAVSIIGKILNMDGPLFIGTPAYLVYSVCGILFLLLIEFNNEYFSEKVLFFHHPNAWIRKLSYTCIIILILMFGVFDGGQFIYFQF